MQLPQYPRYESYKPSGVDWLGDVPGDWQVTPGRACLYENKDKNTGMKESTVLSLSYGNVIVKPEEKLTGLVPESFETYQIVEPGDIIIRGTDLQNDVTSLRTGLAKNRGIITSAYINLRPHENVLPFYLHYVLHSYDVKKVFYGLGSGLRQNLSYEDFKYLDLPLPDIATQERIVAFLDDKTDKIDRAVKIKEGQIALLRERKQIIIQEAVTKGLNPDAPMKDSGIDWIGEIPAHWDMQPLRAIFGFRNEKNDPVRTENILSLSIAHGVTEYTEEGRGGNKRKDDLTAYKLAYEGDIVLNSMNVIVGAVGRSKYFGAISPVYYALYPLSDSTYVSYFENIFLNAGFQRGLLRYGKGILMKLSGTGQLNTIRMKISTNDLKVLPFPIPSDEEQKAIVEHIEAEASKIDAAIELKARQIEALKEYKATLINAAVTGKIKVI